MLQVAAIGKFGLGRVADDGVEGVSLERLGGNGVDAPRVENESGCHHEPHARETQEFAGPRSHLGILVGGMEEGAQDTHRHGHDRCPVSTFDIVNGVPNISACEVKDKTEECHMTKGMSLQTPHPRCRNGPNGPNNEQPHDGKGHSRRRPRRHVAIPKSRRRIFRSRRIVVVIGIVFSQCGTFGSIVVERIQHA
eukprot:scaffold15486_cov53-Attheya_sp.AAC.7